MPRKSRIDARPPHSPARSCPWPPRSAYQLEAYDEMEARQAGWLAMAGGAWLEGGPELATRPPSPITAYTPNAGMRGNGGQAPGALHHIIAGSVPATCLRLPVRIRTQTGASHRQVGKSVIRGEKKAKAKKYSLTGK